MTYRAIQFSITTIICILFFEPIGVTYSWMLITIAGLLIYFKSGLGLATILMAVAWCGIYCNVIFDDRISQRKIGKDIIITGEIITLVTTKTNPSFELSVTAVDGKVLDFPKPKVSLRWFRHPVDYPAKLALGQQWRLKVKLKALNTLSDSTLGGFSGGQRARHLSYQGIIKRGELITDSRHWRHIIYERFKRLLPEEPNAMLYALSFGDRSNISQHEWELYRNLGLSHLIAISGLHIGLIFGFVYFMILLTGQWLGFAEQRRWALFCGVMTAAFYVWLSGFALPAFRALLLIVIGCCYRIFALKVSLLQLYSVMLAGVLLADPVAVLSISFWLSFTAVAAVFILLWLRPWFVFKHQGWQVSIRNVFVAQILLSLLLLPLQLLFFGGVSWLSPLVNFVYIPLFTFVVLPALLIAIVCLPLYDPLTAFLLKYLNELLNYVYDSWQWINSASTTWLELPIVLPALLLCYLLLVNRYLLFPLACVMKTSILLLLPLVIVELAELTH